LKPKKTSTNLRKPIREMEKVSTRIEAKMAKLEKMIEEISRSLS
jgi:hypothetical protein